MKMHPRAVIVEARKRALLLAVIDATADLTSAESLQLVTSVMSDHILGIAKYAIREERHGDQNKPGDVE